MKLSNLLEVLPTHKIFGSEEGEISAITDDSRKVSEGCLFVAIKGSKVDAHELIPSVIESGAVAVVGQNEPNPTWLTKVAYVKVENAREALSLLASRWYKNPSSRLKIIGVTGTKGKTTTANLIFNILKTAKKKVGLISSIGAKIGKKSFDIGLHVTSPEPLLLHSFLSKMVEEKCEYAVLEVTSHALDQERVAGINFGIGVLTNVTHEHLDYHKTFEAYRAAKAKLFKTSKFAVVNADDKSFNFFKDLIKTDLFTFSLGKLADYQASQISEKTETFFRVVAEGQEQDFISSLRGEFNVQNCLAAIATARKLGVGWDLIRKGVASLPQLPGHFEEVKNKKDIKIYVDFAHSPDSLDKILSYVRTKRDGGKVISVFGCAGERDTKKRAIMGEISAKLADISIFTAEDPRNENLDNIIAEVVRGARKFAQEIVSKDNLSPETFTNSEHLFLRIPFREEAIAFTLQRLAKRKDQILFLGKGHEKSMAYKEVEHPWSEKDEVTRALDADSQKVVIILAAGRGTRMNSDLPKVLNNIAGRPIISYTLANLRKALFGKIVVVVGYRKEMVMQNIGPAVDYATQEDPLGTGHALKCGLSRVSTSVKNLAVVNGDDSAFYTPKTLEKVYEFHQKNHATVTFVSLIKENPTGLGRIIRNEKGEIAGIVEEKEANDFQRKINEVNIGFYVFNTVWLRKNIDHIRKSSVGEYYIVDLICMAIKQGKKVETYKLENENEWVGVNTVDQLIEADQKMRIILTTLLHK